MDNKNRSKVSRKSNEVKMTPGKAGGIAAGAVLFTGLVCGLLIFFLVGGGSRSSSGGGGSGSFTPAPSFTPDPSGTPTPPPDPAPPGAMVYRQEYQLFNTSFSGSIVCNADPDFFGGRYTGFCFDNYNLNTLYLELVNQNDLSSVGYVRSGDVIDMPLTIFGTYYNNYYPGLLTRNAVTPADGNLMYLVNPLDPGKNVKSVFFQIWHRNQYGVYGDYIETGDALQFTRVDANNLGTPTTDFFYAISCGHDTANKPWNCYATGQNGSQGSNPVGGRMGKFFNYNQGGTPFSFEYIFRFQDVPS